MVDIFQEGHSQSPAPQKRHKVHQTGGRMETEAGTAEGRRPLHRGRVRSSSWLPELFGPGKAQNPGPTESVLLWSTRKPEPEQLGPGKSTQLRAGSLESSREPEQCRRGKHTRPEQWQTQCGRNTGSAPHTGQ